jgi:ribosomal protein S6--L-glutamate ligase
MRFCFIVEEKYSGERGMLMVVARHLQLQGHVVDVLEPAKTITCVSDLPRQRYDAYVMKTVVDGPGLSLLEAAEASGIPTINSSRSIRCVRDKTVQTAIACAMGLPYPRTYLIVHPRLLEKVPETDYPLVVKPTDGSSGRDISLVRSRAELAHLKTTGSGRGFFLAQHYVENLGYDIKLYVIGRRVYAIARKSPLHSEVEVPCQRIPLKSEWLHLALRVGDIFGLNIYGLDVVATSTGPVVVDINDFPSFGHVPRAVSRLSNYIIWIARHARARRGEGLSVSPASRDSDSSGTHPLHAIVGDRRSWSAADVAPTAPVRAARNTRMFEGVTTQAASMQRRPNGGRVTARAPKAGRS